MVGIGGLLIVTAVVVNAFWKGTNLDEAAPMAAIAPVATIAPTETIPPAATIAPTASYTPIPLVEAEGTKTPFSGTLVVSEQVGIAFAVPNGIDLYSEANPGPLQSLISAKDPYILVNPDFRDENVGIQIVDGMTDSDLNSYKEMLDSNPNSPLPGYKRISVGFINIGKDGQIKAVEHRFQMQGNVLGTMRSISFIIGKRGFILTCATAVERFEKANRVFFEPFLKSIEPVK